MNTIKKLILFAALFAVAEPGFTALVIIGNQPHIITFDEDIPWFFRANRGGERRFNIAEPERGARIDPRRGGCLFSEGAAASCFQYDGDGSGGGGASRFLRDGNQDGDLDDILGAYHLGVKDDQKRHSFAYKLAGNNDYAVSGLYLRIQNKTGAPVSQWTFSADIYYGEPDSQDFSQLEFSYAVDNSTNPNEMTFTPFGKATPISQGNVVENLAGTLNETVTTIPVEDGGYIVLAFKDLVAEAGSDIYMDNIGITAVKAAVEYYEEPTPVPPSVNRTDSPSESDEIDLIASSNWIIFAIGGGSLLALLALLATQMKKK